MQSRVRWTETIQLLTGQGIVNFVEVGTGNVLLGLITAYSHFRFGLPAWQPRAISRRLSRIASGVKAPNAYSIMTVWANCLT